MRELSRVRPGDIVAFYYTPGKHRKLMTAMVLSWSGDPDQAVRMVTTEYKLHRAFRDRLMKAGEQNQDGDCLLTAEQGASAKQRIDAFLESKAGRQLMERIAPAERADPYWLGAGTPVRGPSGGPGAYSPSEPPLVLSKRGGSSWSGPLERYLCGTPYAYAMRRLKEEYPAYWQVWRLHEEMGMPVKAIARELETSVGNVKIRKHRARLQLRGYVAAWFALDAEKRVA